MDFGPFLINQNGVETRVVRETDLHPVFIKNKVFWTRFNQKVDLLTMLTRGWGSYRHTRFQSRRGGGASVEVGKKNKPRLKSCPVLGVCPGPLLGLKKFMVVEWHLTRS